MKPSRQWWFNLPIEERKRRTRDAHERYRAKPEKLAVEKAWREQPHVKEKMRRASYAFHREKLTRRIWLNAKRRAVKMEIPFTIALADIIVPEVCPVLNVPLRVGSKLGSAHGGSALSPTLDRKIPILGYVPGNICVISMRANALKNSATLAELEALIAYCRS